MALVKVGIVGCGCIGSELCRAVAGGNVQAEIAALNDITREHAQRVKEELRLKAPIVPFDELVELSEVIAECAAADCAPRVVEAALSRGKTALIMSVGGLMQRPDLFDRVREDGAHVIIPSGALAGVDAVEAGAVASIDEVTLTTTKPPAGLRGAPYVVQEGIDLDSIVERTVIFEGSALDAVSAFPQNVNVAATLSLAGIGPQRTRVKVVVDPTVSANTHEVRAAGAFGTLATKTENVPSADNPKTSQLAVLSAIAALRKAVSVTQGR
jgi:aspartate dehydrogenase